MSSTNPSLLPDNDLAHYFLYDPNHPAAIFFIIWFAVLAIIVGWQAEKSKQRWLHSLTLMSALESSGYLARYLLYVSPNSNAFKAELVILILAPNLLALCCYMVMGKMIAYLFPKDNPNPEIDNFLTRHPTWIPRFYVMSDILSIAIQGVGGAILAGATTPSELNQGKSVEVAGLAIQLFFLSTFLIICAYVWTQMKRTSPKNLEELRYSYFTLAILVALLMVRNIYRTIEFSDGGFTSGYFQENEAWYLVFDPTLMSLALMVAIGFDFSTRLPEKCLNPPPTNAIQTQTAQGKEMAEIPVAKGEIDDIEAQRTLNSDPASTPATVPQEKVPQKLTWLERITRDKSKELIPYSVKAEPENDLIASQTLVAGQPSQTAREQESNEESRRNDDSV